MQEPNKIIKWSLYQFDFQNKNIPSEIEEWEDEEVEEGEGFEDDPTANMPVILNTPFGFCRVDDSMNPFKRFDFWMGHTTFDITPEVRDSLKVAYGVEVLHLITRYRFIIAIGKAFNFRDVRVNIEKELCGMHKVSSLIDDINNPAIQDSVKDVHNELKECPFWCVYVFPNGNITSAMSETKTKKFLQEQTLMMYAQQVSNGILITSEDENE